MIKILNYDSNNSKYVDNIRLKQLNNEPIYLTDLPNSQEFIDMVESKFIMRFATPSIKSEINQIISEFLANAIYNNIIRGYDEIKIEITEDSVHYDVFGIY